MAICGRVGGSNKSVTADAFSEGMDWINFSPPFGIVGGGGGEGVRRDGAGSGTETCDKETCGLCVGQKFFDKVIVCVGILGIIFGLRWVCCSVYMRHYPHQPKPPDMSYPNWEGPVLIMQLFGLCDVSIKLMLSGCWQVILCGVFEFCWFVCFSEQSLFVGLFVCLF